jgi:hypothetical protein
MYVDVVVARRPRATYLPRFQGSSAVNQHLEITNRGLSPAILDIGTDIKDRGWHQVAVASELGLGTLRAYPKT